MVGKAIRKTETFVSCAKNNTSIKELCRNTVLAIAASIGILCGHFSFSPVAVQGIGPSQLVGLDLPFHSLLL